MRTAIDPISDRPAYKQIADAIRDAVSSGEIGPGEKVPSEADLIRLFNVAQGTVRNALSLLRAEGLLRAEHGKGVFVRERPPMQRKASNRFRRSHRDAGKAAYTVDAEALGIKHDVEVFKVGPDVVPDEIAERLGVPVGSTVLVRSRRYLHGPTPTEIATSYVPWSIAEGTAMAEENPGPGGIYARIEEAGHRLGKFTEDVTARMPMPDEAKALHLPSGTPVMRVLRTAYDTNGVAVEVCDTVMTADLFVLSYELPAD
ncbi:GntR family transcriptional regulator [Actinocrinis puniceicyclus]|uniref:GntR family transcriptional regulator n=1 Tax=Actinocrinis puniceicyclus TaxID=977794 RepID=A0A8J7WSF3_9ACTN|nr:GntR family transcriptional regulator [Actinocrinis puniceicyclus]MBS2966723.1 GntR family transcriptional regulator [Actinocrinis puniceicyclus]